MEGVGQAPWQGSSLSSTMIDEGIGALRRVLLGELHQWMMNGGW